MNTNRKIYVIYSSITHATEVKRALSFDPRVHLMHAPREIPINSCAYALCVPFSELEQVIEASEERSLPIRGAFENVNGKYREVKLS